MPETYAELVCGTVNVSREVFEAQVDAIADALFALEDGQGARFSANPNDLTITFGFVFNADSEEIAPKAITVARAAIHAAGAATPDWPDIADAYQFVEATQRALQDA